MTTTTAPRPIEVLDQGLYVRRQDHANLTHVLLWGPKPGSCACGQGCKGRESLSRAGIRSERDAQVIDAATRGWTLEEYLAAFSAKAGQVTEAEPKRGGTPAPVANPEKAAQRAEAHAYLMAYTGSWDFMLGLKADAIRKGPAHFRLTDRMVEVILGSKAREAKWAEERAAAEKALDAGQVTQEPRKVAPSTIDLRQVQAGRYAVINGQGEVTFLRIDRPDHGTWEGWVFVKVQVSDDFQRIGAQRPQEPTYRGQWPALLAQVLADPQGCAKRYGQAIGSCASCGRTLTNAESREYGIGPECRGKWA